MDTSGQFSFTVYNPVTGKARAYYRMQGITNLPGSGFITKRCRNMAICSNFSVRYQADDFINLLKKFLAII
jgi:hypothetical protein